MNSEYAPDFHLAADDGRMFRLSEQKGRCIMLVFYPGDDTPVCTAQLCDYRDGLDQFRNLGIDVVGISSDSTESHKLFKEKHALPFTLLSDPDYTAAKAYGAKDVFGTRRSVFLIDAAGKLRYSHREKLPLFRRKKEEILIEIRKMKHADEKHS